MMGSTLLRRACRVSRWVGSPFFTACALVALAMLLASCRGSCGTLLCAGTVEGRAPVLFGRQHAETRESRKAKLDVAQAQARGQSIGRAVTPAQGARTARSPASTRFEVLPVELRPRIARSLQSPGTTRDPRATTERPRDTEATRGTAIEPGQDEPRAQWPTLSLSRPPLERAAAKSDEATPSPVAMSRAACEAYLRGKGVAFSWLEEDVAVQMPIRLRGPIRGIEYLYEGRNPLHEVMDCRLAAALYQWADMLEGVSGIQHFSIYRPGARVSRSGKKSGHATGLAIDVGWVVREDGERWSVENDWTDRRRGVAPCEVDDEGDAPMDHMRRWVCAAAEAKLFQVILTPHHDRRHHNHLHLELRPGVDWDYVR